ncbi:MAG: LysR family transcriptional regulator [Rhizobiales bacterium]|nr:LysR substrate-binding domain-containing protein [Hyphomicrobiales bacterium]NRB14031.1 LysR family transcriptional regulator [Hyphomicrobiales bacterium]
MNLRELEYLVAVAQFKHFGKAATYCHVSQPALSMQLKKLEQELGVLLFERNNKQVLITKIGTQITMRARLILQQSADLKQFAKGEGDVFSGELRLGAFPTLAPYYLPKIVPKIALKFPKLKLLLVEEKTDILIKQLQKGELDCAFMALPVVVENLDYQHLFDDEFYLAVANTHKLAGQTEINLAELNHKNLLLLEDGHCMRQNALDICQLSGANEQQEFRATSLETLRQMVRVGGGITLMPKLAMQKNDGLHYIKFSHNPPVRRIALVWRKTTHKRQLFEKLIKLFIE